MNPRAVLKTTALSLLALAVAVTLGVLLIRGLSDIDLGWLFTPSITLSPFGLTGAMLVGYYAGRGIQAAAETRHRRKEAQ